ncbi:MAG TPA: hypothetical protein VFB38_24760 [Chthonomonadaceae bacterium]|nr:hypothetical protein [Chthonomonadaceae bacterium]
MLLSEAKTYIGQVCSIRWRDRSGKEQLVVSKIYDATYVPLYGGYLITDADDIRLDHICEVALAGETVSQPAEAERVAA